MTEPTMKAIAAEEEELFPDEHGRDEVEREPGQRDRVGRQARLDQPVADELAALALADRGACRAAARARGAGGVPARSARGGLLSRRHLPGYPLATRGATAEKRQTAGRARASHVAP